MSNQKLLVTLLILSTFVSSEGVAASPVSQAEQSLVSAYEAVLGAYK